MTELGERERERESCDFVYVHLVGGNLNADLVRNSSGNRGLTSDLEKAADHLSLLIREKTRTTDFVKTEIT